MKMDTEFLRKNPVFWSRLGFCYDPPVYKENGELVVFAEDYENQARYQQSFTKAGVTIHTCILNSGWVGVNKYDYSLCDKILDAVFKDGGAKYFIPRVKLNVPVDWCRENPEDVCVYYAGPREKEEIRALVDTPAHDWLGYASERGYYNAYGWQDTRPNVGGKIARQSFSSDKWLCDASEALVKLMEHIDKGPYGDKIVGYHIAFGVSGETCMWGRFSGEKPFADYGIVNQKKFYEWGLNKYGSAEALEKAWGKIEGDVVPPPADREKEVKTLEDVFLCDADDMRALDYDRFIGEMNVNAISHFAKVIKEEDPDKITGAFYGYILGVNNSNYTGWLEWQKLLASPYVDFMAAPKSYFRTHPGEPGGEMAPTFSINGSKMWMDECDSRTHLASEKEKRAENLEESNDMLLREYCKNLSHNSGMWFMDLGGGWYDDEGIMEQIGKIMAENELLRDKRYKSVSEVLMVVDEESMYYTNPTQQNASFINVIRDMYLCGLPSDTVFARDLLTMDLSQYKLVIFLNAYAVTEEYVKSVRNRISPDCLILWNGCAGYAGKTKSLESTKKITGFDLLETENSHNLEFAVSGDNIKPLLTDENGNVRAAYIPDGDAIITKSTDMVKTLREIARLAGCHFYAPAECTVYADNRIVSVFPREDVKGTIRFPHKVTAVEFFTGKEYKDVTEIPLDLKEKQAVAYRII